MAREEKTQFGYIPLEVTAPDSEQSQASQEQSLLQRLGDLKSSFAYMGKSHPQLAETKAHIEQLQRMLAQVREGEQNRSPFDVD